MTKISAEARAKIAFAKSFKEVVIADGQTFYFGPGVPETDALTEELSGLGFHTLLTQDNRLGLCWNKGR